jgi:hypothetical protein
MARNIHWSEVIGRVEDDSGDQVPLSAFEDDLGIVVLPEELPEADSSTVDAEAIWIALAELGLVTDTAE